MAPLLGFMPQVYCWRRELWGMLGYTVGHYIITDLRQQQQNEGSKRTRRSRVDVEIEWILNKVQNEFSFIAVEQIST